MNKAKLTIFFDGGCPLCKREIDFLQSRNQKEYLRFIDINNCEEIASFKPKHNSGIIFMNSLNSIDVNFGFLILLSTKQLFFITPLSKPESSIFPCMIVTRSHSSSENQVPLMSASMNWPPFIRERRILQSCSSDFRH